MLLHDVGVDAAALGCYRRKNEKFLRYSLPLLSVCFAWGSQECLGCFINVNILKFQNATCLFIYKNIQYNKKLTFKAIQQLHSRSQSKFKALFDINTCLEYSTQIMWTTLSVLYGVLCLLWSFTYTKSFLSYSFTEEERNKGVVRCKG